MKNNKLSVTKVGKKIGKRTKYTVDEKIEILRLLKENSFDYKKTCLETGVNHGTLKNWFCTYKDQLNNLSTVALIAENVEQNISKAKIRFIDRHFNELNNLAEEAIKRALKLVKDEVDLSKVNGTIKVISDLFSKISDLDSSGGDDPKNSASLIKQTIIQLNSIKNNA